VLLIQEHRIDGPGLPGIQALVAGLGWHGVWAAAEVKAKRGRSGGTAVFVRQPIQTSRAATLERATLACVAWTRTVRIHVGSVYGPDSQRADRLEQGRKLWQGLQSYLSELGSVPWVFGGDWNMEPGELQHVWVRPASQVDCEGPTHKHGGNLDWYLHAPRMRAQGMASVVVPGTDHVSVRLRLPGHQAATLGKRLVQPRSVPPERLLSLIEDRGKQLLGVLGDPPYIG
jgi:hypothetical protein